MNFSLKSLNRCDWYVVIWFLYQMQGFLYPEGPIGQGLQALLLAWALFETKDYILPSRCHPPLLKATSILLFMYCVYGIPLIMFNPYGISSPHVYLQLFLSSFIPVIMFYRYIKEGYLTEDRLRKYIWLFLIVTIWQYFKYQRGMMAYLRKTGSSSDEITNNAGYDFLAVLPITFYFYKKPLFQYSLLCIILLFIVMAMKRGPIIIGAFCFVCALIVNIKASKNRKQRYATICLGVAIVLLGTFYVSYQLSTSDYMKERIEETRKGNSSGRDLLYSHAIDAIVNDTSVSNLMVGRGAWATIPLLGKAAHQDWLETAVDNGLLGIAILIYFVAVFLNTILKKNINEPMQIHTAFILLFFIFILRTMFSMSLADMPCYQTMLISFCIYSKENRLLPNKIQNF